MFKFLKNLFKKNPYKNGRRLTLAFVLTQSHTKRQGIKQDLPKLRTIETLLDSPLTGSEEVLQTLDEMFGENVLFYQLLASEVSNNVDLTDFKKFLRGVISVVQML